MQLNYLEVILIYKYIILDNIVLVTIARYTFPYEAHIAWSLLDSEGIPAFVVDEYTINMQWLYSNALGGVRLQVPKIYEKAACNILAKCTEIRVEGISCPECGSTDTEYYQFGKNIAFLLFLFINFPLFPVKDGIKCNKCGIKTKI